jgi:hypothetical protein
VTTAKATTGALPILEQYRRWLVTAQSHRRSLGLDPMARGALTKDLAVAKSNAADALRTHADEGARVLASRQTAPDRTETAERPEADQCGRDGCGGRAQARGWPAMG